MEKDAVMLNSENVLYSEEKDVDKREKVRRKVVLLTNRRDNLITEGMRTIKRRRDIVVKAVDKGGGMAAMEKQWHKEEIEELITEDYRIRKNESKLRGK